MSEMLLYCLLNVWLMVALCMVPVAVVAVSVGAKGAALTGVEGVAVMVRLLVAVGAK
jgi:hypothetical protein